MLSTKAQTNLKNAKTYFEEHLATGDYYTEAERVSGEWIGAGAEMLGLSGVVGQKDFVALCDNTQPLTGQRLTQRQNHTRTDNAGTEAEREASNRRVFFDFTFSPPKSASIIALVGGDQRVIQAHREAGKIAVRELERFASTRVRQAGNDSNRATGNIVAALLNTTVHARLIRICTRTASSSRPHMPRRKARWKALQNYQMLIAQKYVENVIINELARALRSCGYTLENAARGDFRVTEVSPELCERFSKRHREIDQQTQEFLTANPEKASGNVDDIREQLAHKLRSRKIHDSCAKSSARALEESALEY
ncbi:MAG: relaxase domain-containing protein [Verrucomicrobiota bacterium]|nr:relaxase domain-containing protein [Verrucomicrobiota bacterium]